MSENTVKTVLIGLLASIGNSAFAQDPESDGDGYGVSQDPFPDQVFVAEEDAVSQEPVSELSDEELLRQEFLRYRELIDDGVLDEADSAAKRIIELSIRLHGPDSINTARALTNLAIVQQMNEQYDAARQNFRSAIEVIEDQEDRLNTMLINPLKGLGKAQLDSGRPDLAARTFQRAVHITHVNEGPHNMDQLELLESLAETNLRLGDVEASRRVADKVHVLNQRYYRDEQMALVPSLSRRARWQHRTGYFEDERATYRRIIAIISQEAGRSDVRLVQPLINLGRSYFFVDASSLSQFGTATYASAQRHFKRALQIAEESGESNWQLIANSLLAYGDYQLFMNNQQRAAVHYREAWNLLSSDAERLRRRATLTEPLPLRASGLPRFAASAANTDFSGSNAALQEGFVEYEYGISTRGTVTSFRIARQIPGEFQDISRLIAREMRARRYRPAISENGPISLEKLTGTHRFYYKQSDLDALRLDMEESQQATETTSELEEPSN